MADGEACDVDEAVGRAGHAGHGRSSAGDGRPTIARRAAGSPRSKRGGGGGAGRGARARARAGVGGEGEGGGRGRGRGRGGPRRAGRWRGACERGNGGMS
ncbi:hypothetical protein EYW49_09720 [Siculibacillus lacustris]|uniref:Uncharacterized protein n=1 Tax=Siculibacillus lacustris TaxID=1549641 RepID=A0A4V2KTQ3_9HYPH|nr:hypothetical protein EYW49_09720 [Siculibacillus lacustris]